MQRPRSMQKCFLTNCSLFMKGIGRDAGEAGETGWKQLAPILAALTKMTLVGLLCKARALRGQLTTCCDSPFAQGHAQDCLQVILQLISEDKQDRFAQLTYDAWALAHLKRSTFAHAFVLAGAAVRLVLTHLFAPSQPSAWSAARSCWTSPPPWTWTRMPYRLRRSSTSWPS
jgi:hypothetical protein